VHQKAEEELKEESTTMHSNLHGACGLTRTGVAPGSSRTVSKRTRLRNAVFGLGCVLIVVSCGDDPTASTDPVSVTTPNLAEAIEGLSYGQQLEATGGSGPYSWLLAAGSLPSGLTLTPSGAISGTPAAPGTSSVQIRVTDSRGRTATADFSLSVIQTLAMQTETLPEGVAGSGYSVEFQAVGGRGAHTWTLTPGDGAGWLSISSTGQLSGTPSTQGTSTVTVAVGDESGQQATRHFIISVLDPISVAAITLPTATQGRVYLVQLVATGGDGLFNWELEGNTLPAGMSLGSVGDLAGTPEEAGTFTFTAWVTDRGGRTAQGTLTLHVERAPTIQTISLPPGEPGTPYAAQLSATGGTGTYTWKVTEGVLPEGLTLSAAGAVSGTPMVMGGSTFMVQVTDEAAATHSRAFTIEVASVEALVSGTPVTGIEGEAGQVRYYSIEVPTGASQLTVAISGGTGDVDLYVRRGALPAQYVYDCRPLRQGNEEICTFTPPYLTAGHWYIMLRGYTAFGGVILAAIHDG
jgi:hypothetical protein